MSNCSLQNINCLDYKVFHAKYITNFCLTLKPVPSKPLKKVIHNLFLFNIDLIENFWYTSSFYFDTVVARLRT